MICWRHKDKKSHWRSAANHYFMEINNETHKVELSYLDESGTKETHEFKNIFAMINCFTLDNTRVHVFVNDLSALICYLHSVRVHLNCDYKIHRTNYKDEHTKAIAVTCESVIFRDVMYTYGTDKYSTDTILRLLRDNRITNLRESYTSFICKSMHMDEIKKVCMPPDAGMVDAMIYRTDMGAYIVNHGGIEYENLYCNDVTSAYPAWQQDYVPVSYKYLTADDVPDYSKIHFGRITFVNLKIKDTAISCVNKPLEPVIEDNVVCAEGRTTILSADKICVCGWIELYVDIVNHNYTYDSMGIEWTTEWEMGKLPEVSLQYLRDLYDKKTSLKGTADYDGIKVLFNRSSFGVFSCHVTDPDTKREVSRDPQVPFYLGCWIQQKQKQFMCKSAEKVGKDKVVAAHTDSLYTTYDCTDLLNEGILPKYKDLGLFAKDKHGKILKARWINSTRGKLLFEDGTLEMKHGGIAAYDVDRFLKNKTYDDITDDSNIFLSTPMIRETDEGGMEIRYHGKLHRLGDLPCGTELLLVQQLTLLVDVGHYGTKLDKQA